MQIPRVGLDKLLNATEAANRLWGRVDVMRSRLQQKQLAALAVSSAPITTQLVAAALESPDRFQISGLQPVDRSRTFTLPWDRQRSDDDGGRDQEPRKPLNLLDWLLLGLEALGALVVAWLAFQYIYTTYIDTAPRRLTSPPPRQVPSGGSGAMPTATATVRVTASPEAEATATFVSEVLPPMLGGGSEPTTTVTPGTGATPAPTVSPEALLPNRLRIPVMFLDSAVHEVTVNMGEWEVSPMDVGHHEGTANPGEVGNVVLAGHRDINSALFRELDRLQPGDEVFVSNDLGEYRYLVEESLVVSPDYVQVMDPTDDKRLTLITCTPPGLATQRLVVIAKLDESSVAQAP
ncbi:MAG: class D sortase [Chloroflexota bacterium]|nr:class D sortase [Chloroflexota bacterium]MDQ5866366.1 class D sortase [Chloroflexota bacterium]